MGLPLPPWLGCMWLFFEKQAGEIESVTVFFRWRDEAACLQIERRQVLLCDGSGCSLDRFDNVNFCDKDTSYATILYHESEYEQKVNNAI